MTPREARALAKVMFRQLAKIPPRLPSGQDNPGFFERAAVLADVVLQSDRSDVGEQLALAARGRVSAYSGRFYNLGYGAPVPVHTEATELANAIAQADHVMFPPRRAPCMPNRADLRRLVINAHGDFPEAREWLRRLWREMEETCNGGRRGMATLDTANSAIRGDGVESMAYRTHDGEDIVAFDYVNTGDTYSETVGTLYEPGRRRTRRFLITTWGDVMEQTERRMGDRGAWGRW